uniref:Retinol dehydrogenase 16 n=1 Tax=Sphenodon punctatus TaxID=8508 RepID=A0A8D0LCE7_SPHPU
MWLYLAALLLGLYFLRRWYRERQTVENLTEKYVFITGCDTGFGNLLARHLDARGLRVLAACLTQQGAEELGKVTSERLQTTLLDVTSTESVAAAAAWAKEHVGDGGLWGLVNNAGITIPGAPNGWLTKEDFQKVLNVNLLGTIDVTLHLLPLLMRARGRVVNVSSVWGRISILGGAYSPSKYAVEAFSDSLRRELLPFGTKVCIIEPGFFHTAATDAKLVIGNLHRIWERVPEEIKLNYTEMTKYTILLGTLSRQPLSMVTNCMEHALTALHPRTRYSAGWDAMIYGIPASYLPTVLVDQVVNLAWLSLSQKS